jgi:RimJ/RimL family protein N-acetyltransferase
MMKIIRYSGIRLKQDYTFPQQLEALCVSANAKTKDILEEARQAPFLLLDFDKNAEPIVLIRALLQQGELLLAEDAGKIIAYVAFRSIVLGRDARLEIYVSPQYRNDAFLKEFCDALEDYAFTAYPEGLQLHKVRATIHPENKASLTAAKNREFYSFGILPFEGLFNGQLTPMIYLELYPKQVRDALKNQEVLKSVRSPQRTPSSSPSTDSVVQLPQPSEPGGLLRQHPPSELPISERARPKRAKRRSKLTGESATLEQPNSLPTSGDPVREPIQFDISTAPGFAALDPAL